MGIKSLCRLERTELSNLKRQLLNFIFFLHMKLSIRSTGGTLMAGLVLTTPLFSLSTFSPKLSFDRLVSQAGFFNKGTLTFPVIIQVASSAVLDFAPWLELHHVVFISEPESKIIYSIDYSPINQKQGVIPLLLGKNIPAEIRVRSFSADDFSNIEDIKAKWSFSCFDRNQDSASLILFPFIDVGFTSTVTSVEGSIHSQRFIKRIIKRWDTSMNLYTHNCQHFSMFVTELLKDEEVCLLEDIQ